MTSRASKRKEWLEQETKQAVLESTVDAVLNKASQGTPEMRKSLQEMKELLKCSLCKCIYVDPVSLVTCGHSFCRKCIENHNCDDPHCPGTLELRIISSINLQRVLIHLHIIDLFFIVRMRITGQFSEREL